MLEKIGTGLIVLILTTLLVAMMGAIIAGPLSLIWNEVAVKFGAPSLSFLEFWGGFILIRMLIGETGVK